MAERVGVEEWALRVAEDGLAEVLLVLAQAGAKIASKIRVAGLGDVYGAAGATNVQGEQQQKLDVYANEIMIAGLEACESVAGLVSEENEEPIEFNRPNARFVLAFDPLDGSSNIDVNVNVGTIFGVRERVEGADLRSTALQPGSKQMAAGYVLYGPSVVMVVVTQSASEGSGVAAFTLDESGEFALSAENLQMPEQGSYYSVNGANAASWPAAYREYVAMLLRGELGGTAYSERYIGSLVADFHRTLLKGGVFLYPPTDKAPGGKLRLQYEANPLAMIAEAAGGAAVDGKQRILEIETTSSAGIHARTPFIVGGQHEVGALLKSVAEAE